MKYQKAMKMLHQDITIIGAGPGGSTAALQLNKMGIPSLLLEKSNFPRDKTCGDALSGKVTTLLHRIHPEYLDLLEQQAHKRDIWGIRLIGPDLENLDLPFTWNYDTEKDKVPGYVMARHDFDQFLSNQVKRAELVDLREGMKVDQIERVNGGFQLSANQGSLQVKTRLLLVANGAHSDFSREYGGIQMDRKHYAAAVRAYFDNVPGFHPDGFIELHFLKEYIPGYFWIFPMSGNRANVGLGLRSDIVVKRRVNLKKELMHIVNTHPSLKDRFKNARLVSNIKGHPLPLGSKKYRISGDHYMLLGDAGHLVDPLTGEGVGNAMYSGWIAAEQAAECLKRNDFSAGFMDAYDVRIHRVLGQEMKLSYQMQRLLEFPLAIKMFSWQMKRNDTLRRLMIRMYSDLELRKQLVRPGFWLKVLSGRI